MGHISMLLKAETTHAKKLTQRIPLMDLDSSFRLKFTQKYAPLTSPKTSKRSHTESGGSLLLNTNDIYTIMNHNKSK